MKTHQMVGHLIRRLNQISTQVFAKNMQEAGLGLTPVQFAALDAIATHPGIDQVGVASEIAYDRATIGGVIDRLEQKGYIVRSISERDRRAREVRLTKRGQDALKEAFPVVTALQSQILPGLSDSEKAEFLALATKVVTHSSKE